MFFRNVKSFCNEKAILSRGEFVRPGEVSPTGRQPQRHPVSTEVRAKPQSEKHNKNQNF